MRSKRVMPIVYMLFGAVLTSFLLFLSHRPETKPRLALQDNDGSDFLTNCETQVNISVLKELYLKKMKYLADKKLIKTMPKAHNCTRKLLEANPEAWCYDMNCNQQLAPAGSPEVFESIAKPLKAVKSDTYRRIQELFGAHILPRRKYVFLLAISENHYLESMATIRSLHAVVFPNIRNFTFYVYDMGITTEQIKMLKRYGRCTVRKYPFNKFPERVQVMKTYTWKPILIQAHIDVGEFVVYMDASVRFKDNLVPLFETLGHTGFLMTCGFHALALQTSNSLFSYFGDNACAYASYVEFEGAFIAFHNEEFSRKLLLEPWVACALDPFCMAQGSLNCAGDRLYGRCHRFDLSAMTLMLVKLFREDIFTFSSPRSKYHYVKQGRNTVLNYLEELRNKTLHT